MVTSAIRTLVMPVVALCLAAGTGCASRSPAATPAPAALDVPPAPPRVISVPPEPVTPVQTTTAEPTERPAVRPPRPAARTDSGAVRPGQSAEVEAPVPAEAPAERATEPAATAPLLRTPQTRDESQADRRIREVLKRASSLLEQVTVGSLSREARTQHDTARRFVDQAGQALLERNYVFASYLADKAETMARGLSR